MPLRKIAFTMVCLALSACKHPLDVQGLGDIVELLTGERGCTAEQARAGDPRCTGNEVVGETYAVSYQAQPRPGWEFVRWEGTGCAANPEPDTCSYNIAQPWVEFTDQEFPGFAFPATRAVFRESDEDGDGMVDSIDPSPATASPADTLNGAPLHEIELFADDGGGYLPYLDLREDNRMTGSVGTGPDDTDSLSMVAPYDGTLTVRLSGLTADLDISLYDGDLVRVELSELGGTSDELIETQIRAGDTYTVAITNYDGSQSPYVLDVSFDPVSVSPVIQNITGDFLVATLFARVACTTSGTQSVQYPPSTATVAWTDDGIEISTPALEPGLVVGWDKLIEGRYYGAGAFHQVRQFRVDSLADGSHSYNWMSQGGRFEAGGSTFLATVYIRNLNAQTGEICDLVSVQQGVRQ